jgi:hypothetical protein
MHLNQSPNQLLLDTLAILNIRSQNDGWTLPTYSQDTNVYTGIAGGLAGIGLKLLETRKLSDNSIFSNLDELLLNYAEEISTDLVSSAKEINDTNAVWSVSNDTTHIELGWDFGLAGISAFYTELYNQTQKFQYIEIAEKIFQTIFDLANHSNGLSWHSNVSEFITALNWYPQGDFLFYPSLNATFNGVAFGTAGIAKAALSYLRDGNDSTNILVNNILNESLIWLEHQSLMNGSELSFTVAHEFTELKSTNYATGVSGIGGLYIDLMEYTGNVTYLERAESIMHWLNGTETDSPRWKKTWEYNETLAEDFEIGLTHGLAGIVSFISRIYEKNPTWDPVLIGLATLQLLSYGSEDENKIEFPERVVSNKKIEIGSTSWSEGAVGIFHTLLQVYDYMNETELQEANNKIRSYLLTQTKEEGGRLSIHDHRTNQLENNPYRGMPGLLSLLVIPLSGILHIQQTELQFGMVELGKIVSFSIVLENLGDLPVSLTWTAFGVNSGFSTSSDITEIAGRSEYLFNVSFTPSEEKVYSSSFTFYSLGEDHTIDLEGTGFDRPSLTVTSSLANDSILSKLQDIDITIVVEDSSTVQKVEMKVDDQITALSLEPDTNIYSTTWATSDLSNGTYTLEFTAFDILGNTNSINLVYTIGIYTSNIAEKAFSERNRNILIGVIAVLFVAAIFITRRYMN